jgi:HlyD family secretion protein
MMSTAQTLIDLQPSVDGNTTRETRTASTTHSPRKERAGLRRFLKWLAGLVILAGAGVGVYLYLQRTGNEGPRFETVQVTRGRVEARLVASGSLSPLVTVQVGSQVSGRIQKLFADYNKTVRRNQLIARIDPQLFIAAVSQARANRMVAEAALARAKLSVLDTERQLRRTKDLAERKLVSQADLDTAQVNADSAATQVLSAKASIAQAEAAQKQAEINLAYTNIYSPIDGVVISRNVDVGQTVAASLQAPTLFSIAEDLAKMQVHANVSEADIGRVQDKMAVSFTVDAYPREPFLGTVREVRNSPQTVQNVVTYDVVIDVDNAELKLKPGMTASVTFVYAVSADTLLVPNAALRFRPPAALVEQSKKGRGEAERGGKAEAKGGGKGGAGAGAGARAGRGEGEAGRGAGGGLSPSTVNADRRTVWKLIQGEARPVKITVGISDGTLTSVVKGNLSEGDALITEASGFDKPSGARPTPLGMPPRPPGPGGQGRGALRRL